MVVLGPFHGRRDIRWARVSVAHKMCLLDCDFGGSELGEQGGDFNAVGSRNVWDKG